MLLSCVTAVISIAMLMTPSMGGTLNQEQLRELSQLATLRLSANLYGEDGQLPVVGGQDDQGNQGRQMGRGRVSRRHRNSRYRPECWEEDGAQAENGRQLTTGGPPCLWEETYGGTE